MALTLFDIARDVLYILPVLALVPILCKPTAGLCFAIGAYHLFLGNIFAAAVALGAFIGVCIRLAHGFPGLEEPAMEMNVLPL